MGMGSKHQLPGLHSNLLYNLEEVWLANLSAPHIFGAYLTKVITKFVLLCKALTTGPAQSLLNNQIKRIVGKKCGSKFKG